MSEVPLYATCAPHTLLVMAESRAHEYRIHEKQGVSEVRFS